MNEIINKIKKPMFIVLVIFSAIMFILALGYKTDFTYFRDMHNEIDYYRYTYCLGGEPLYKATSEEGVYKEIDLSDYITDGGIYVNKTISSKTYIKNPDGTYEKVTVNPYWVYALQYRDRLQAANDPDYKEKYNQMKTMFTYDNSQFYYNLDEVNDTIFYLALFSLVLLLVGVFFGQIKRTKYYLSNYLYGLITVGFMVVMGIISLIQNNAAKLMFEANYDLYQIVAVDMSRDTNIVITTRTFDLTNICLWVFLAGAAFYAAFLVIKLVFGCKKEIQVVEKGECTNE